MKIEPYIEHPITKRLNELGKTQGWLAAKVGVTQSEISSYVTWKKMLYPSATKSREIAKALNVDFNYLGQFL